MITLLVSALVFLAVLSSLPKEDVPSGERGVVRPMENVQGVALQLRGIGQLPGEGGAWRDEFLGAVYAVPVSGPPVGGKSYLYPHLDRTRAELGEGVWPHRHHGESSGSPPAIARMLDDCPIDFSFRVPDRSPLVTDSSDYTLHDPIFIHGDGDFTAENGVVSGIGTILDPFVIEGWEINASLANGIRIVETDAHFIIRDVFVHSGTDLGISLAGVANGRVENSISSTHLRYGIDLSSAMNVTLSANIVSNNARGIRLWTSTNVTLSGNTVSNSRWEGIESTASASVTLTGNTISNNSHGIHLSSSPSVIFTENSILGNHWDGIHLSDSDDAVLTGNYVSDNGGNGVELSESTRATLVGNSISENGEAGILLRRSTRADFTDNTIADNGWDGIFLSGSPRATITGNTFTSNGVGIYGWLPHMEDYASHTITPDNLVNGRPLYYYADCDGLDVDGIEVGQMIVADCRDVRIASLEIVDAGIGLQMAYVDGALVTGNSVTDNRAGIRVSYSTDATISGNDISNNSRAGIRPFSSTNVTVSDNDISGNGGNGVEVYSSSVSITGNVLSRNSYGITVSTGGGQVIRNGFLHNEVQVSVERGAEITWDNGYPAGGNYWSDHNGEDNCSGSNQDVCPDPDGILDSPYIIDIANRDRYPLVSLEIPPPPPDSQLSPWGAVIVGIVGGSAAAFGIVLLLRSRGNRKARGKNH